MNNEIYATTRIEKQNAQREATTKNERIIYSYIADAPHASAAHRQKDRYRQIDTSEARNMFIQLKVQAIRLVWHLLLHLLLLQIDI